MTCDRSVVFSGTTVSSNNKTVFHNITEILLKVHKPQTSWMHCKMKVYLPLYRKVLVRFGCKFEHWALLNLFLQLSHVWWQLVHFVNEAIKLSKHKIVNFVLGLWRNNPAKCSHLGFPIDTTKCILFVKDYPRIFMQISHLNDADVKEMSIFEISFPWQPCWI